MSIPKPSNEEEDYFAKVEIEKRKNFAEEVSAQLKTHELEALKKQHWMRCAKCGFEMYPLVYKGLTIDKCPNCQGIYLDAGELEILAGKEGGFVSSVLSLFKS